MPRGGCGPEVSAADIAAAVGFLRRAGRPWSAGQRLLLYLWAGHDRPQDRTELILALHAEVAAEVVAITRLPLAMPREKVLTMVAIALDELAGAGDYVCRTCSGVGFVEQPGREPVLCPACHGAGRRWMGVRALSSRFGTSRMTWARRFDETYKVFLSAILGIELQALRQLSRALKDR